MLRSTLLNLQRTIIKPASTRSFTRSFTKTISTSNSTSSSSNSTSNGNGETIYPEQTNRSIVVETLGLLAVFAGLTFAFSATGKAMRLEGHKSVKSVLLGEDEEEESKFLFARGGRVKDPNAPVFSRDEVTVIIVIGGPKGGKTSNAQKIAKKFDMQFEAADSDIYSDIALNLPTAHLSNPNGSSKLRIVVDDFTLTAPDPLAHALQFEESIAPILLFLFVDCPLKDAELRVDEKDRAALREEYAAWSNKIQPLIKHYRHKANFLEITGEWTPEEQWAQVEAKVESALELEARGEL